MTWISTAVKLHVGYGIGGADVVLTAWLRRHDRSYHLVYSQRRWPAASHRRKHPYVRLLSLAYHCRINNSIIALGNTNKNNTGNK